MTLFKVLKIQIYIYLKSKNIEGNGKIMLHKIKQLIPFCSFVLSIFMLTVPLSGHAAVKQNAEFQLLISQLITDGFDKKKIEEIFSDKEIFFSPDKVSAFFIHNESSLNYDQFLSKKDIESALKYLKNKKDILDKAQDKFGVDKTIITAILLVETRLGSYTGNTVVINTLATIASLSDKKLRKRVWDIIPDERKPAENNFIKKAQSKSGWAYDELKAFLIYVEKEGLEPASIKGSYAGAIGISQFMPSNILKLATDGNNDGRIDLFNHDDAIFSIAQYLKYHGWKPDLTRQRQHEILYMYNHSNYYVDTLLKISDKLKEQNKL
jgi:membrane-bound lytic murein transglycosylase B